MRISDWSSACALPISRIRALLRRPGPRGQPVLEAGNLQFDTAARTARCGECAIDLSRREADLLELLLRRAGTVVRREMIEDALYNFNEPVTPNAVEAAVSRLRRKLDEAGATGALHTIRGVGYMLKDVAARSEEHTSEPQSLMRISY